MNFGEIAFYTIVTGFILYGLYYLFVRLLGPTKEQKEYDRKLKESLKDEYIIDPETGAKLTLEQAESGHWIGHDNEFLTTSETEINKLFTEEVQEVERTINELKHNTDYRKHLFNDADIEELEQTHILSKYDSWSYSDCFSSTYMDGYVFLAAVQLLGDNHAYFNDIYHESQIMFWIKSPYDLGHYFLREKSTAEKLLDMIKKDDELTLTGYESFTYQKTSNMIQLIQLLKHFEGEKGLEIEFNGHHILFKNLKLVNRKDLFRMEEIARSLAR